MKPDSRQLLVNLLGYCVAVPVIIVVILLVLAPESGIEGGSVEVKRAKAAMCAVAVAEWLALSLLVPAWTRRYGWGRALLFLIAFIASGLTVSLTFPAGRAVGWGILTLNGYLLSYGAAMAGLTCLLGRLTGKLWIGQTAAAGVAFVLAANVLLANPVLEKSQTLRSVVIAATLATNPIAASGAALGYDPMREKTMYESSHITYYNYSYPPWYVTIGLHAAVAIIMIGIAKGLLHPAKQEDM